MDNNINSRGSCEAWREGGDNGESVSVDAKERAEKALRQWAWKNDETESSREEDVAQHVPSGAKQGARTELGADRTAADDRSEDPTARKKPPTCPAPPGLLSYL